MDKSTAQRTTTIQIDPATGLDAAAVVADPPDQSDMVSLVNLFNTQAPAVIDVLVIADEDATLTGACYFAWDADLDAAVYIGKVHGGADLTLKAGLAAAEPIELVAGIYTHLGIGRGTLSAGNLALHVRALEIGR